jgi:tRNA (guanine37-N1)-methyltransferase
VVVRPARADDALQRSLTLPPAPSRGPAHQVLPVSRPAGVHFATQLTTKLFQQRIANPANNLVDVAEVAGNLVGYTWVKFPQGQEPPPAADVAAVVTARPQAELSKIYVDVEYAGTGVAGVLIDRAITAAADRGIAVLWLGTNDGNRRAQRFYRRHGLRKVGTRSFLVGDYQNLDAIMAIEFD